MKLIWWVIIIIAVVIFIKVKVPYAVVDIDDGECDENKTYYGTGGMFGKISIASLCMDYKTSQCNIYCSSDGPKCICRAIPYDMLFNEKGEWLLDLWGGK